MSSSRASLSAALVTLICASACADPPSRLINRADYADRLRAMWLGEVMANWTGLRTENQRSLPPYFTDADWGTQPPDMQYPIIMVTWADPWASDDDTDIEYVYLHLLSSLGVTALSSQQIASGWISHINGNIYVSNASSRALMTRGVLPPATGLFTPNANGLMIDAQLTTEFFGAFTPGMPDVALRCADTPIRTTSSGYATHAAQFYAALYALAPCVDRTLSGRDQAIWLVEQARRYVPDTSKAADVIDFVLADFLANSDLDDWESTRDAIDDRYRANAAANGFIYRAWYESSINLATGVLALLYGQMDYIRTVQIGTLSGWDSDNGTATMGGLTGLVLGYADLKAHFPPHYVFSDRYYIHFTRPTMPDLLPADAAAEDNFTLMAQRMLPIIERTILDAGGRVDAANGLWLLPPAPRGDVLALVPTQREESRSANVMVRRAGGTVTTSSSVIAAPWSGYGSSDHSKFANSTEADFSGIEEPDSRRGYYSSLNTNMAPVPSITLTVTYDRDVAVHTIRLIEGDRWDQMTLQGGWFDSLFFEAKIGGVWTPLSGSPGAPGSPAPDPAIPFQILDFALELPVAASAIRLSGSQGGLHKFVTVTELDALAPPLPAPPVGFDLNSSGLADVEDLYAWHELTPAPPTPPDLADLNGDGAADADDVRYLRTYLRWLETQDMASP